jgi:hypothetical protein
MDVGALALAEAPGRDRNASIRPSSCRSPAAGDPAPPSRDTGRFNQIPKTAPTNSAVSAIVMGRIREGFISGY